jgi:hypothetical protein
MSGHNDKSQEYIRPRFLQMLVLLLSLLNNDDLDELKDFIEVTYGIKADRQNVEILILKVLPLMSINSRIFMKDLVAALNSEREDERDIEHESRMWTLITKRLLQSGYMLPGTVGQLGESDNSWIIKWPEEGIKDSHVFRNLQYTGRYRTINEIPSVDVALDSSLSEVTVVFANGKKYSISQEDIENVTCMTPGQYPVTEANAAQVYYLEITEEVVNAKLYEVIFALNRMIREHNSHLSAPRRRNAVLARLSSIKERTEIYLIREIKGSGRLTINQAILQDQILAVAYKVEGRRITRRDLLRNLISDIKTVNVVTDHLDASMQEAEHRNMSDDIRRKLGRRRQALLKIRNQVAEVSNKKSHLTGQDIAEWNDEPISRVLYTKSSQQTRVPVWHEYRSWYVSSENILYLEAVRQIVENVKWVANAIIEVSFFNADCRLLLAPLTSVSERDRTDEVRPNDAVILVGQYIVVVDSGDGSSPHTYEAFVNWLKIVSVEQYSASRRGLNRKRTSSEVLPRWSFR